MSNSQLSEFISKVQENPGLSGQFKNVRDDQALSALASGLGYNFTADEIKSGKESLKSSLLSGNDLDSITGGLSVVQQQWYGGD